MIEIILAGGKLAKGLFKAIGIRGYIMMGLLLALAAQHAFYEGMPVIRSIPFVGRIPGLGGIAIGRIQTRVNAAVSGAQHAYAIQAENAAKKAQADAEAESKRQATIVTDEYQKRLAASRKSEAQASKDLANEISENQKLRAAAGLGCAPLDDRTADLLRQHGFQVDR